jgi:hypothetical protein
MKNLNKILTFLFIIILHGNVYAQITIKSNSRKYLIPQTDSLEKLVKVNKIIYALISYSTSNWISLDYIFYALIKKKKDYYLMRLANLDVFAKQPELKINQKKLTDLEAEKYLKEIASAEAFKYTNQDYHRLPESCTTIHGTDTVVMNGISDNNSLCIFEHTKTYKKSIDKYDPFYYLKNCYPYNTEYGILKGFTNTYAKLTELVKQAFKDDPILPIQNRPRKLSN